MRSMPVVVLVLLAVLGAACSGAGGDDDDDDDGTGDPFVEWEVTCHIDCGQAPCGTDTRTAHWCAQDGASAIQVAEEFYYDNSSTFCSINVPGCPDPGTLGPFTANCTSADKVLPEEPCQPSGPG